MTWLALLLLLVAPFWETKAPNDWTENEVRALLTDSPWAQMMPPPGNSPGMPVQIYLATAAPMIDAEKQRDLRFKRKRPDQKPDLLGEEYRNWLEDNRATQIVVAIGVGNPSEYSNDQELHQMQEECVMKIGRKKIKMTGHFPPSQSDPYLRLAFPRDVTANDKTVSFDLYLPGVGMPFRGAEFKVKDLILNGKLEM